MKILIADDHALFRDALKLYIEHAGLNATVFQAKDMHETMNIMKYEGDVALVLLDLRMPGLSGKKGLKKLLQTFPESRIVISSGVASKKEVDNAIKEGASGFFPKTISGKAMIGGIKDIMDGKTFIPIDHNTEEPMPSYYMDEGVAGFGDNEQEGFTGQADNTHLTPREKDVLKFLMKGASNQDIADALDLKIVTVKLHIGNLFKKFGVKNRTQVVLTAQNAGFDG